MPLKLWFRDQKAFDCILFTTFCFKSTSIERQTEKYPRENELNGSCENETIFFSFLKYFSIHLQNKCIRISSHIIIIIIIIVSIIITVLSSLLANQTHNKAHQIIFCSSHHPKKYNPKILQRLQCFYLVSFQNA